MNQFIIAQLRGDEKEFIQKPLPLSAGKRNDIIRLQAGRAYGGHLATSYRGGVICMSDYELIMIVLTVLSIVVTLLKD